MSLASKKPNICCIFFESAISFGAIYPSTDVNIPTMDLVCYKNGVRKQGNVSQVKPLMPYYCPWCGEPISHEVFKKD